MINKLKNFKRDLISEIESLYEELESLEISRSENNVKLILKNILKSVASFTIINQKDNDD